jgi:hypothetical protein
VKSGSKQSEYLLHGNIVEKDETNPGMHQSNVRIGDGVVLFKRFTVRNRWFKFSEIIGKTFKTFSTGKLKKKLLNVGNVFLTIFVTGFTFRSNDPMLFRDLASNTFYFWR